MRILLVAFVIAVLLASSGASAHPSYVWTISGSRTDCAQYAGTPVVGLTTVYLWLAQEVPAAPTRGITAAEFSLQLTGFSFVLFILKDPWLAASVPPADVLLAVPGCPSPPMVVADIVVLDDGSGGQMWLGPSGGGFNVSVDCEVNSTLFPNHWIGYSSTGAPPPNFPPPRLPASVCQPVSVEPRSWGSIKGLYH